MPNGPRCGDPAKIEYEVTPELVGALAHVRVYRLNTSGLAAEALMKIEKPKSTIVWPDLEKEKGKGDYYGGSRYDSRGLAKEGYQGRFKAQEFKLEILCGKESKESDDTIPVTGFDDEGPEEKKVGLPVMANWTMEKIAVPNPSTGIVRYIPVNYSPAIKKHVDGMVAVNVGHYRIAFKDGEVVLTVKLEVEPDSKKINKQKLLKYIKTSVEAYWNDAGRGLGQWVYHRKNCVRKEKCNCSVHVTKIKDVTCKKAEGCCKFSVRLQIEEGADNKVKIHSLTKEQIKQRRRSKKGSKYEWAVPGVRADTGNLYFPENRFGTYAHEIGHMLGLPDQYAGGATSNEPGKFPIDENSVMGKRKGGGSVQKEYLENTKLVLGWVDSHVDSVEPIKS